MTATVKAEDTIIFFGGLSARSTERSLIAFVEEQFGPVAFIDMPVCRRSFMPRGFAKIRFKEGEAAAKALATKYVKIDGIQVTMKPWVSQPHHLASKGEATRRKIYVRFPKSMSESMLHFYFSQFGEIEVIDIRKDLKSLEERCFCYITFQERDSALKAAAQRTHRVDCKKLRCKLAISPSEFQQMSQGKALKNSATSCTNIKKVKNAFKAVPEPPIGYAETSSTKSQSLPLSGVLSSSSNKVDSHSLWGKNLRDASMTVNQKAQDLTAVVAPAESSMISNLLPGSKLIREGSLDDHKREKLQKNHRRNSSWLFLQHCGEIERRHKNYSQLRFQICSQART